MTDLVTTAVAQIASAGPQYATISYVPQKARVTIGVSGIGASIVRLEAQWNQTGPFVVQKTWTLDPTEAEHFDAPRACALRIGVAAGGHVNPDVIDVDLGFDYPLGAQGCA